MKNNPARKQPKEQDLAFYIRVQYRQNATMQGTIQWMDGRKSSVFRSALELGHLINEALKEAAEKRGESLATQGWEKKQIVS